MRKNVRKKTKYARKCARKYLAGAKKRTEIPGENGGKIGKN
jgi:hypothetical protein